MITKLSLITAIISAGVTFAFLSGMFIDYLEKRSARKLFERQEALKPPSASIIDAVFRPIFSLYTPFLRRFEFPHNRKMLDKKFTQAALTTYSHEDFWGFQILSSFLFALFLYVLALELRLLDIQLNIPWWLFLLSMGLGFFFPYLWLNSLVKKRRKQITLEFPTFVANLTLTVEAGLDFIAAMNRIVKKMKTTPLRDELSRILSEIQLGSSRAKALKGFGERIGSTEISTFTLVLIQADKLGTSIGKVLRVQAERLRRERFETAERKGAIASQKLLFPLVFFIMPAVFIVIFGPLVVRLITQGLEGLML